MISLRRIQTLLLATATETAGTFWLRDFLPRDIPGARVYSFGYDSQVLFTRANGDINTFARSLLANLVAVRSGKLQSRPLVFLCHSMGGLVVKQVRLRLSPILDTDLNFTKAK